MPKTNWIRIGLIVLLLGVIFLAIGPALAGGKNDKVTSGSSDPARALTKADLTQKLHKLNASGKPVDVTLSTNTLADLNGMCVELTAPGTVMVNQHFDLFVCITTSTSSLFLPVLALPAQFTLTGERITADSPTRPQYNFTEPPAGVPPIMPSLYSYMGGNIPAAIWAGIPPAYQTGYNFVNLVDNMRNDHWLSNHMYIFEWRGDNITWHFSDLRTAQAGDYKFGLFLNAFWEDSLTGETRSGFVTIEEPLSVRVAVTIPDAPSNLIATAVSAGQIDLTYQDNSDNEEVFNIERRTLDTPSIQIATLAPNTTTYSDIGLNPSTTYFYRINASNSAGNSPYSNETFTTTLPPLIPIPIAPSNLVATAVSHSQIDLHWSDNSEDETGFIIERHHEVETETTWIDTEYECVAMVGPDTTSYSDYNLLHGSRYWYHVRAYSAVGYSHYSNEADATTYPVAPVNLVATVTSHKQINLSWDNVSTNYNVSVVLELSTDGINYEFIGGANVFGIHQPWDMTYTLEPDTTYYYRAWASNRTGYSADYSVAVARTLPFTINDAIQKVNELYQNNLITDKKVSDLLVKDLNLAQDFLNRGSYEATIGKLGAVINKIHAKIDKSIDAQAGWLLCDYIRDLTYAFMAETMSLLDTARETITKTATDLLIPIEKSITKETNALTELKDEIENVQKAITELNNALVENGGLSPGEREAYEEEIARLEEKLKELEQKKKDEEAKLAKKIQKKEKIGKIAGEGQKNIDRPKYNPPNPPPPDRTIKAILEWTKDRMNQAAKGTDICPEGVYTCTYTATVNGTAPTPDPETGAIEIPAGSKIVIGVNVTGPAKSHIKGKYSTKSTGGSDKTNTEIGDDKRANKTVLEDKIKRDSYGGVACNMIYVKIEILDGKKPICGKKLLFHLN